MKYLNQRNLSKEINVLIHPFFSKILHFFTTKFLKNIINILYNYKLESLKYQNNDNTFIFQKLIESQLF